MSSSSHSWSAIKHRGWETDSHADSSDDEEEADDTPEHAGEQLGALLTDLKISGKMSATNCCLIAYWASRAGAIGIAQDLGKAPGAPSGHYSAHFDKFIGHRECEQDLLWIDVPCYRPFDASRGTKRMPVFPPHECLSDEAAAAPDMEALVRDGVANGEWPPCYGAHPVVQRVLPRVAVPLAVYLDGVQFSRRDNVLGVFVINLATNTRHLAAVLRKYWMCRCGCRGWRSVFCILQVIHWSMVALAEGLFPSSGPFGPLDSLRSQFSGSALGLFGACIFLKADWSEYAHNLGFWTWSSKVTPCPLCDCKGSPWVQSDGFDALS